MQRDQSKLIHWSAHRVEQKEGCWLNLTARLGEFWTAATFVTATEADLARWNLWAEYTLFQLNNHWAGKEWRTEGLQKTVDWCDPAKTRYLGHIAVRRAVGIGVGLRVIREIQGTCREIIISQDSFGVHWNVYRYRGDLYVCDGLD